MSGEPPANPGAAAPPPKPRLKLNVSRASSFVNDANNGPSSAVAPPSATLSEGGARKVKLKIGKSQPATPADEIAPKPKISAAAIAAAAALAPTPVKTKAGRQPKPTQKLVESKKRPHDDDDDDDVPLSQSQHTTKIRLKPKGIPSLVVKTKGRPPTHPPGDGYDSEASDREIDPAIEEQFILRMPPGEHCDYVRSCMETGKIGIPRSMGGADIHIKFFEEDTRRACMTVKGQHFAAVMVDLPTITESMKTWDKKSFLKSADICQMLLVFQPVSSEQEARQVPLPSMIDSHFKWPHGLTPPMHDCVNRRFAKTISRKEIEDKEAEVERLLLEDAKAGNTRWEWVDERRQDDDDEDGDEDAEGEMDDGMDYFEGADGLNEADLEADLEAAFADDLMAETPAMSMTPLTGQVDTPAAGQDSVEEESDEDDDDDDEDDDDDDLDEDARAQRDEEQGVKDIIADMTKTLASKQAELERVQNRILRSRLETQIKQLKSEIELKKSSIGLETDD